MKVFVTGTIPQPGLSLLHEKGIEVLEWKEKRELTNDELVECSKSCDALLSVGPNKIDKQFLQTCSHLKVIALHSVGYNKVAVEVATELGIPISNTPEVLSDATADIAFLLMLAASRQAFYAHKQILAGKWGFFEATADLGLELKGCTLGIFGLGNIGLEMARRCAGAYQMKVIYHNRGHNKIAESELNAQRVSFNDLLTQSDIISVHANLSEETKGTFNLAAFSKMKPQSIFVNVARGAIHHEADLLTALQKKMIWGAGLDVTDPEPMRPDNPLLSLPTVAILPHIGSATVKARNAMSVIAAQNIIAGLNGERLPQIINSEVYDK